MGKVANLILLIDVRKLNKKLRPIDSCNDAVMIEISHTLGSVGLIGNESAHYSCRIHSYIE